MSDNYTRIGNYLIVHHGRTVQELRNSKGEVMKLVVQDLGRTVYENGHVVSGPVTKFYVIDPYSVQED